VREIRGSYRATVRVRTDRRAVKAIAEAAPHEGESEGDQHESDDRPEQLR